jgi:hypothetical protein
LAQTATKPHHRALLLEIAGKWTELALQLEKEQAILRSTDSDERQETGGPTGQILGQPISHYPSRSA